MPSPAVGILLAVVAAASMLGLARTAAGQEPAPEERKFRSLADEYLDQSCRQNPSWASSLGFRKYDATLDDFSPHAIEERVALARRFLGLFDGIDRAALSTSAAIDLDLVRSDAEATVFTWTELASHKRDPSLYNDTLGSAMLYLTVQPPDSPVWPERLRSVLGRARAVPQFLDQARANLENPSPILVQLVIDQNPGNIQTFESDLPQHFSKAPAEIRSDLESACAAAAKALRDYQTWLEKECLPNARGDWRLGRDLWTKKLRITLQTEMTPEQILERAWARFRSGRQKMFDVAEPMHREMFPGHLHAEAGEELTNVVVREVIDRVSERHSNRASLFADALRWIEKIKGYITWRGLLTLPPDNDNFVVEPTPGYLGASAVGFFNPAPAFEPDMKKSYWISPLPSSGDPEKDRKFEESYLREYNDYGLQSLTIHEAFPGHYVQYWYAQNSPLATITKKVYASGTFAEGWAVLAEDQMFSTGFALDDPANLLVHLKMGLRTPLNAILDQTMHTSTNMSDEQVDRWALDLMTRSAFQEDAEARGKLRRAKVTSAQLSTYFVGFVELSQILDDWRAMAGPSFSYREFNEKLLNLGTIPPRDARKLMLETAAK